MGLYLCVFDDEEELDGVEVGSYSDFEYFRNCVTQFLECGYAGSKFPTLINHSDSDGEWTVEDCNALKGEFERISTAFQQLPCREFNAEWQRQVGRQLGLKPATLFDSFVDVDGEPLLDRLIGLCDIALARQLPISFQ